MPSSRRTFTRQQEIRDLLYTFDEGLTRQTLADTLSVNRSTISRDVGHLKENGDVIEKAGRVHLVREKYWVDVRLSVDELQALVLACRSLAVNLHWNLPFAAQALRKLAQGQSRSFPVLSRQIRETADQMDANGQLDGRVATILSSLGRAIERRHAISLWYQSSSSAPLRSHQVLPGRLEPYAPGHSVYLFAMDCISRKLLVFKVSRIRSLALSSEPSSADELSLLDDLMRPERLHHSWGIWVSDAEPQRICLRFAPRVAVRVRETRWHQTQTIEDGTGPDGRPDGSVVWTAWIREPLEMLPWIRGWGEDCEILSLGDLAGAVSATENTDVESVEEIR